jgi:hypothetical protein
MMLKIEQLMQMFKHLTALEAVEALIKIFHAADAGVYLDNERITVKEMEMLLEDTGSIDAHSIYVSFYGGPPKGKMWNGTLLTMFVDHFCFSYVCDRKKEVAKAMRLARKPNEELLPVICNLGS